MMKKVPVTIKTVINGEYTATDAIKTALSHPLQFKAQSETEILTGSRLVDGWWGETFFLLKFSDNNYIHICVEKWSVFWILTNSKEDLPHSSTDFSNSEGYTLEWSHGSIQCIYPNKFIKNRIGKKFSKIFVNEVGLYIYFHNCKTLTFQVVKRQDNNKPFLYVYEE